MKNTGSCLCGFVTFEARELPLKNVICYCRDCQKAGGTDSVANAIILKDSFSIVSGSTKVYVTTSERKNQMERHFCPTCGTPIYTRPLAFPKVLSVRVANFDDSSWYRPEISIYCGSALSWSLLHEDTDKFERHQN